MKRSASVVMIGAMAVFGLSGCSSDPDATEICEDADHVRVADERCEQHHHGYTWVYIPGGGYVPRVGERVTGATAIRPGGTIARGGLGGRTTGGGS